MLPLTMEVEGTDQNIEYRHARREYADSRMNNMWANSGVGVLRDTGCSGGIIRRSMCSEDSFTGETRTCVMINGDTFTAPVVSVSSTHSRLRNQCMV